MVDTPKQIVTRAEAKELGLSRYYTGKPCKHGHVAERRTNDKVCTECRKKRQREHYIANREEIIASRRPYVEATREQARERARLWNKNNKERKKETNRKHYLANSDVYKKKAREWNKKNPDNIRSRTAKRRAAKLKRTVFHTDKNKIKVYYTLAESGMHVDHIIPLQGETVSGLHVHQNLQIIDGLVNSGKGNSISRQELDNIAEEILNHVRVHQYGNPRPSTLLAGHAQW